MIEHRARSGSPYEASIGFSRAVRSGAHIAVSGTAPVWPDGSCNSESAVQTVRCLDIIAAGLTDLGSSLRDVVRTADAIAG